MQDNLAVNETETAWNTVYQTINIQLGGYTISPK